MTANSPLTFAASVIDSVSSSLTSRVDPRQFTAPAVGRRTTTGPQPVVAERTAVAVLSAVRRVAVRIDRFGSVERYE